MNASSSQCNIVAVISTFLPADWLQWWSGGWAERAPVFQTEVLCVTFSSAEEENVSSGCCTN